jgi:hypothetical protein
VKIAVLRKGRESLAFIWAAAHCRRYARGFSNVHLFICTISANEARGCESKREAHVTVR